MARHAQQFEGDEQSFQLGDSGFIGVNMRLEPHTLPPGYVSEAINMRFRNGVAETRLGVVNIPWVNKFSSGSFIPWGTIYGIGRFRDPTSQTEYIIIANADGVYFTAENGNSTSIPLPAGVTITGNVDFIQCFNVLIMLRGKDNDSLAMNNFTDGFEQIVPAESGTGTLTIPRASIGDNMANRLFLVPDKDVTDGVVTGYTGDNVVASDLLDYTNYSIADDFRINQGEDDIIVQIKEFGKSTLVCLKSKSVYRVDNVYGTLSAASLSRVTDRYGCAAKKSVVDTGTDMIWLSKEGVASLTLTTQGELQASQGAFAGKPPMLSEPIQPLIERINWEYAENAQGIYWDNKYYLAVPLDDAEVIFEDIAPSFVDQDTTTTIDVIQGATYRWAKGDNETNIINGANTYTSSVDFVASGSSITVTRSASTAMTSTIRRIIRGVNNAMLVYDFLNRAWSGYDEIPETDFKELFTASYRGRERLFIATSLGWVQLYEEDYEDQLSVPYTDFEFIENVVDDLSWSVNGGTTVSVSSITSSNTNTVLGSQGNLSGDINNLWDDQDEGGGYGPDNAGNRWTSPDCYPTLMSTGIRFRSTNGLVPSVNVITDDESVSKVTETSTQSIASTLKLRAYQNPSMDWSYYQWATLDLQTWNPSYSISFVTEGVQEEDAIISDRTKDRTKFYRPFSRADYVATNTGGDFMDPYRKDYSLLLGDNGATSFSVHTSSGGVRLDLHQETRETVRLNNRARAGQLKLVNTVGRIRLIGTKLEGTNQQERGGSLS